MRLEDYKLVDELIEEAIEDADVERMLKLQKLRTNIGNTIDDSERQDLLEYMELRRVQYN